MGLISGLTAGLASGLGSAAGGASTLGALKGGLAALAGTAATGGASMASKAMMGAGQGMGRQATSQQMGKFGAGQTKQAALKEALKGKLTGGRQIPDVAQEQNAAMPATGQNATFWNNFSSYMQSRYGPRQTRQVPSIYGFLGG